MAEDKLRRVASSIAEYPDFPKPGILFQDIFSLLASPSAFKDANDLILQVAQEHCPNAECVVGLESRGFLFGPILAQALNIPFVPVRKKGKLPGELFSETYQLEYGTDTCEIQTSALKPKQKVLIIDDLLATGGTMTAACRLVEKTGAVVSLCLVLTELADLKGREAVGRPVKSILSS